MSEGHIKLFRKLFDWEWYSDINTTRLFIHCLLKANWKEGKFQGKVVPRGSFITSYANLARETGLSVHQTRIAINKLKMTNELTTIVTSKYTIINVVNYRLYQDASEKSGKQNGKQCDNQVASKWQQYNNSNKERINNIYSSAKKINKFNNYSESSELDDSELTRLNTMIKKWSKK